MNIAEFYEEFMQDVVASSGTLNDFNETVFTERLCDFLVDQAIIENYTYAGYKKVSKGIRLDAWDFNEDTEVLNLFVTDFRFSKELETLSSTDVTKSFKRATKFFAESLNKRFHPSLEESAPGYELARKIYDKSSSISRVQFFLLSNAQLSERVEVVEGNEIEGVSCTYDIWDITRLYRIESSGTAREDVLVDFQEFSPEGIPCLPAFTGSDSFESYLLVMPGKLVADLYDRFGERLLEQNVRSFLQFRGTVNKGIRNTIQNEPEMFFAYNNGLTATAEHVETDKNQSKIKSVANLQIVNGGQTTASIFTAMKKGKAELSNVYVQVKLTVIPPDKVDVLVPKISEYANTQNKVTAADFFSNHPFHLRIEDISRRLWAPSPDGGLRETHWFYERARGQYANAQAKLTPAKIKEFLVKNPRKQMFTKTDLAKFENTMSMQPHIVSLGAQKNFARFASEIGNKWDKNEQQFNELYFKQLVAKAILFRFLDETIMKQNWYGGYKANIVTYTLAKLAYMVSGIGKCLDLDQIWKDQKLSTALEAQLLTIAQMVNERIQVTPDDTTNVTEWCKKELCWRLIQEVPISLGKELNSELKDIEEITDTKKEAEKNQKMDNGIVVQQYVIKKGAHYWKQVAQYGLERSLLSPKEMGIIEVACGIPAKIPSEKQSEVVAQIEQKVRREGFFLEGS
jgi:hypothetical protein